MTKSQLGKRHIHVQTSGNDWLNKHQALELSKQIEAYWARRGVTIKCEVRAVDGARCYTGGLAYAITSNLSFKGRK